VFQISKHWREGGFWFFVREEKSSQYRQQRDRKEVYINGNKEKSSLHSGKSDDFEAS